MNREETIQVLSILRAAYPKFYAGMRKQELEGIVSVWNEMFTEPYPVVVTAIKSLIQTDEDGFPPVIGKVKSKIRLMTQPDIMSEQEAWNLVVKAVSNSTYNSEEEFEKLPKIIQKLVHAPSQLRQWAMTDTEDLQTVIASNFMRSYRDKAKAVRDVQNLPQEAQEIAFGYKPEMRQLCDEKPNGWKKPFEPGAEEIEAVKELMKGG